MKLSIKRVLFPVIATALLLFVFTACEPTAFATTDNLLGSWDAGGYSTWTFTEFEFSNDGVPAGDGGWDYSGSIVRAKDGEYNIASESPSDGNCGYLVLYIAEHSGDSSAEGTYTLMRWRNKQTVDGVTTVEYSEAYPAGWTGADEAAANSTEAGNHAGYSTMTLVE